MRWAIAVVWGAVADTSAPLLLPPQPLAPRAGMALTDVALHFSFTNCTVSPAAGGRGSCAAGVAGAFDGVTGVQFAGLERVSNATDRAACEAACCGHGLCAAWNWGPVNR